MAHSDQDPDPQAGDQREQLSRAQRKKRQQRVLVEGKSSITRGIADAVVIKEEDLFFLTAPDGDIPLAGEHGLGLYYHDCRFLHGYELRLEGVAPEPLVVNAAHGFMAIYQLTNPHLAFSDGSTIDENEIGIRWERVLNQQRCALEEIIAFHNYGIQPIEFTADLCFATGFEDIFIVRGAVTKNAGTLYPPAWQDGALYFHYDGVAGLHRSLTVSFWPAPTSRDPTTARFLLRLAPGEDRELHIALTVGESPAPLRQAPSGAAGPGLSKAIQQLQQQTAAWFAAQPALTSDSLALNRVMTRSLHDLHVLRSTLHGEEYLAAGVPWFATLFGRDSLVAATQMLAFDPQIAEQTLRVLAQYQGQKVDAAHDEEPGKIVHEVRVGEMARANEVPFGRYYGTVDATPLFLVLIGLHAAWTGDLTLFNDLRPHVEAALAWMRDYGDQSGNGYVEYSANTKNGLANQGWKDSGAAIMMADGSLAPSPIALVEVQGYVYLAKTLLAGLYEQVGKSDRAAALHREAADLRQRFNRDFWMEDAGCYCLALAGGGKQAAVIASNPGQALWSGIADADKAARTVHRLMQPDMFSGWGVRTLATGERRYNPIGYHLGTVWPHDNSIIAAGFRRYGFTNEVKQILVGQTMAATRFAEYRLPELFAGFDRSAYEVPVRYPVACHPQAWSAGAVPYLLTTALGLDPDAFAGRLTIHKPILAPYARNLDVSGLRVGKAVVDLHFEGHDSEVAVQVVRVKGPLDVICPDS